MKSNNSNRMLLLLLWSTVNVNTCLLHCTGKQDFLKRKRRSGRRAANTTGNGGTNGHIAAI